MFEVFGEHKNNTKLRLITAVTGRVLLIVCDENGNYINSAHEILSLTHDGKLHRHLNCEAPGILTNGCGQILTD